MTRHDNQFWVRNQTTVDVPLGGLKNNTNNMTCKVMMPHKTKEWHVEQCHYHSSTACRSRSRRRNCTVPRPSTYRCRHSYRTAQKLPVGLTRSTTSLTPCLFPVPLSNFNVWGSPRQGRSIKSGVAQTYLQLAQVFLKFVASNKMRPRGDLSWQTLRMR